LEPPVAYHGAINLQELFLLTVAWCWSKLRAVNFPRM
jgi:hypothetical protein